MTGVMCTICEGKGQIQVDDLNTKVCICHYAKSMVSHLGPEISQAKGPSESPLYIRGQGNIVEFDGTVQNLHLKGAWRDLLPHFKYALTMKGLNFTHKITTDEKLKSIYVGNEAYRSRPRDERDDAEVFNSLEDFAGDPNLLIIRLGFLGWKNVAMAGILKETLLLRETKRKATWIVEDPSSPFQEGHLSYSYELECYLEEHFSVRSIAPIVTRLAPAPATAQIDKTVRVAATESIYETGVGMAVDEEPEVSEDLGGDWLSQAKPKKKAYRR